MGQKTHPKIFRLGVIETWDSKWFARHDYPKLLHEDFRVTKFLKTRLYHAGISRIEIERAANKAKINIHTARPGIVIGKKGAEIEKLKEEITKLTKRETYINIHEVRRPDLDGQLAAENVALQLERRVAFRRAMKESVSRAMRMGAQGVRIQSPAVWAAPNRAHGVVPRGTGAAAYAARRYQLRICRGKTHTVLSVSRFGFLGRGFDRGRRASRKRCWAVDGAPDFITRLSNHARTKKVNIGNCRKGRRRGTAHRGSTLAFGDYGLKAIGGWMSAREIEARASR